MSDETKPSPNPSGVTPPDQMSAACSRFFDEHWQLASFLMYIVLLAAEKDDSARRRAKAVIEKTSPIAEELQRLEVIAAKGVGAWSALMSREQMLLQIALGRAVDNYLIYISDLLALVFSAHPEALRSTEQVTYDEVLQFQTMEDLVGYLAEKKVLGLAYKSKRELTKYMKTRLGFDLYEPVDAVAANRITLLIELRNLITHNRAVINRVFKDRQPDFPGTIGNVIRLDMTQAFADIDLLAASVVDIETRAIAKWDFPRPCPRKTHADRISGLLHVSAMLGGVATAARHDQPDAADHH